MKVEIKTDKRTRYIGDLDTHSKTFSKVVWKSKHLFRKLNAWGIDAEYFTNVLLPDNYTIKIFDKENRLAYYITAKEVEKFGVYYHFKGGAHPEDNRSQIFCPVVKFACVPEGTL